jgi:hypothetical protein
MADVANGWERPVDADSLAVRVEVDAAMTVRELSLPKTPSAARSGRVRLCAANHNSANPVRPEDPVRRKIRSRITAHRRLRCPTIH